MDSEDTVAQIALVVLAGIVAVGTIIAILAMCFCWGKKRSKSKKSLHGHAIHEKPNLFTVYNPVPYDEQAKFNELYLMPGMGENPNYETQVLEMAMPEDLPSKDGLDVGFTVSEGVYSIRPAQPSPATTRGYQQNPLPPHSFDSDSSANVVIPPPDYPTGSTSESDSDFGYKIPIRVPPPGRIKK